MSRKKSLEGWYRCSTVIRRDLHICLSRGVSSTVRRCIQKETGREYACKIIDINNDLEGDGGSLRESTLREIAILRTVAGHPYISKSDVTGFNLK